MNEKWIVLMVVGGTVLAYLFAKWLYKRIYTPFLIPVVVATAIIILFLVLFDISYDTYMIGGKWINAFLGPAVVALAYPLYQQREVLRRLALPLLVGTFIGAVIGILSGACLALLFEFDQEIVYSLIPKSVTTPVAMEVSSSLGGISSLAAVFVMVAGIAGVMLSPYLFKLCRVHTSVGRGVGLGSASHALGTSKALENGQLEGSISTIAMISSAVFVSVLTPYLMYFLF